MITESILLRIESPSVLAKLSELAVKEDENPLRSKGLNDHLCII